MNDKDRFSRDTIGTAPPPKDFDPMTAGKRDLVKHGLPLRPDRQTQPGMAALWDKQAQRYRAFDHLQVDANRPAFQLPTGTTTAALTPREQCGYSLVSPDPIAAPFVTWTVPNLRYTPSAQSNRNTFHTFVGLGFLDVHVEMTVDATQSVTAALTAVGVGSVALPVAPGDVLSASICLDFDPPGRANYFLANETRSQTANFSFDSNFPPAVTAEVGVSRGDIDSPFNALAQFGVVYFDEISVWTKTGFRSLTLVGEAVTLVDTNGAVLAKPVRLNDFAFKVVHTGPAPTTAPGTFDSNVVSDHSTDVFRG